jgi:type IV pilus assembly protein PilA
LRSCERGFTFVEVTLVVLIIGLLIAISVPSFLGAKQRANDRSAQVSLRHTLTNAKAIYADNDSFADVTPTSLRANESSLTFAAGVSTGPKAVSIDNTPTTFVAAAKSRTGLCYVIGDGANEAGTVFAILASGVDCDAANAPGIPTSVPAADAALIGGGWAKGW